MMAKVSDTMYLVVSRCILMYMNGTHRNTCTIHARYMQDTWDTYRIGNYTKTYRKPHVTHRSGDARTGGCNWAGAYEHLSCDEKSSRTSNRINSIVQHGIIMGLIYAPYHADNLSTHVILRRCTRLRGLRAVHRGTYRL